MQPDLHVDPDAVRGLCALARGAAGVLATPAPAPPPALGATVLDAVERLERAVRRAGSELVAFAAAGEAAVRRVECADRTGAAAFRAIADARDPVPDRGPGTTGGPGDGDPRDPRGPGGGPGSGRCPGGDAVPHVGLRTRRPE